MSTMARNRVFVIGLGVLAVVVAIVVIVLLITSTQDDPQVANVPTATANQGEDAIRTQVFAEMTSTADSLAPTNQAATVAAMQGTLAAQSTMIASAQQGIANPTTVQAVAQGGNVTPIPTERATIGVDTPDPGRRPTEILPEAWDDENLSVQSGSVTLGENNAWVVFQGWDGRSVDTTTHGVIEPGMQVIIPAPFQGTYWIVTGTSYEALTERALEMRDEALQQGTAGTSPPIVYVGEGHVPEGYSIRLPGGWETRKM